MTIIFPNLRAEMARNNVTIEDLRRTMKCSEKTVRNKLAGITAFSCDDAFIIRDTFFPGKGIEYLLAEESER